MRSKRTNHTGFSALNLGLHNHIVMSRYNKKTHGTFIGPYGTRRRWWKTTFWAFFRCWEPHNLVSEKRWLKLLEER